MLSINIHMYKNPTINQHIVRDLSTYTCVCVCVVYVCVFNIIDPLKYIIAELTHIRSCTH
jgi:hypothetical protein